MENKIIVSVICNTYNHAQYIKKALDGFVMQRTAFPIEILIHDDASTDGTSDIIREYEKKYPTLIKPLYQKENQHSKGIRINNTFQYPRTRGKYIALCEGDDYWTDPLKLQKQIEQLEAHPEIDICAHAVSVVYGESKHSRKKISPANQKTIFPIESVIAGGGGFVATNSLVFRRELIEMQASYTKYYGIDYSLQIQGAMRGGLLYLPDAMGGYRKAVSNSWTSRMNMNDDYRLEQEKKLKRMLELVDQETDQKYSDIIHKAFLQAKYSNLENAGKYNELKKGELKEIYLERSFKHRVKMSVLGQLSKLTK